MNGGKIKMKRIIIMVNEGRVQQVFSTDDKIDVEILDFDTKDNSEFEESYARYKEIQNDKLYKNIW